MKEGEIGGKLLKLEAMKGRRGVWEWLWVDEVVGVVMVMVDLENLEVMVVLMKKKVEMVLWVLEMKEMVGELEMERG